ncbi:hypothetical protein HanRHA438_Chr01g0034431 [Helianthus annuus]|nr:hypothetical protein HanRHA438_Chr01g0034431 [Helianthus annuus]
MKSGNLLVKMLWQHVYLLLVLSSALLVPQFELGNHLVGERARHHETGVTSGTTQVHETTLSQNNDAGLGFGEDPPVGLGFDGDSLNTGVGFKSKHVDFVVEVTDVADDGIVLHLLHVRNHDDVFVTSGGDEDVSFGNYVVQGEDLESFHGGLESADGVDFCDDDTGTSLFHGGGTTLSDISVTADDSYLSSDHDIGGSHQTIRERVTASIQVVKL